MQGLQLVLALDLRIGSRFEGDCADDGLKRKRKY